MQSRSIIRNGIRFAQRIVGCWAGAKIWGRALVSPHPFPSPDVNPRCETRLRRERATAFSPFVARRLAWVTPAFTLLEIMIVLAIMMMLTGLGFAFSFNMDDRTDKPKDHLIRMARQASRSAIVQGHPVSISFSKKSFQVNNDTDGAKATEGNNKESSCPIPKGTVIDYQRWNGGARWQPSEGLVWTFYPTGISDALHFRIDDEEGRTLMKFNPLTGSPARE